MPSLFFDHCRACAHERCNVVAHPVDGAHHLANNPAILNDVRLRKRVRAKTLADASVGIAIRLKGNPVIAQEASVFLSVFIATDCDDHDVFRKKSARELAEGCISFTQGTQDVSQKFSTRRLPPTAPGLMRLPRSVVMEKAGAGSPSFGT